LKSLTAKQLAEWEEYSKIDPIGKWREDYRLAYLAMLITNLTIQVHGKRGAQLAKFEDFLLEWDSEGTKTTSTKQQSVEDMRSVLMSLAASQNKKVRKTPPKKVMK
jgi:hypothetical protein